MAENTSSTIIDVGGITGALTGLVKTGDCFSWDDACIKKQEDTDYMLAQAKLAEANKSVLPTSSNTTLYVILGSVFFMMILGLVLFLTLRKKK